jgi:hypothetical protein
VPDVAVAEPILEQARVKALVREGVPAAVEQHLGMDMAEACALACFGD